MKCFPIDVRHNVEQVLKDIIDGDQVNCAAMLAQITICADFADPDEHVSCADPRFTAATHILIIRR